MQEKFPINEFLTGSVKLVSLPEICVRINEMLDDDNTTTAELGRVISQDTALTARLLKIVNSSFYGFSKRVETVSRAVSILGMKELRALVIAVSAVDMFSSIPLHALNKVRFWRHSLYCAVMARLLAEHCHVLHSERLFVAGLLHDIGKLVMASRLPEAMSLILSQVKESGREEYEQERIMLGFHHADVGEALLRQWNMPESLVEAVAYHHEPSRAKTGGMEASLIHIANLMGSQAELALTNTSEEFLDKILPESLAITGLNKAIYHKISSQAASQFVEALEIILPRSYPPY